jgi:hypothetical protein
VRCIFRPPETAVTTSNISQYIHTHAENQAVLPTPTLNRNAPANRKIKCRIYITFPIASSEARADDRAPGVVFFLSPAGALADLTSTREMLEAAGVEFTAENGGGAGVRLRTS